ncbi:hypothetical protein Ctob_013421 [Chrysochromulina tobinii]|uniref:Secreted protein n=1 Tax=Chrysochromulina tobinii TaxID=1460289 RepID=A0A0M0K2K0_9EUKA|nr:hypothetical protein Ctob_013421 [Chrysochromulina tobinii]|eukprot:KOO33096.1 hypothetical protein Ctob_013421 [Chrysochromulina sp. CCMP291]
MNPASFITFAAFLTFGTSASFVVARKAASSSSVNISPADTDSPSSSLTSGADSAAIT